MKEVLQGYGTVNYVVCSFSVSVFFRGSGRFCNPRFAPLAPGAQVGLLAMTRTRVLAEEARRVLYLDVTTL